jgi:hypothetical protein
MEKGETCISCRILSADPLILEAHALHDASTSPLDTISRVLYQYKVVCQFGHENDQHTIQCTSMVVSLLRVNHNLWLAYSDVRRHGLLRHTPERWQQDSPFSTGTPTLLEPPSPPHSPDKQTHHTYYQSLLVTMDEDLIAFGIVMLLFLSFPFLTVLSITGCVAYSRTKVWDKARNQRAVSLEASETNRLVANNNDDDESDFYDTEDEEEHNQRQAEEEADKHITFGQKYRKEFKKVWTGKGKNDILKQKEREERRKLAKAVARELDRRERRMARKAANKAQSVDDLPAYTKA